MKLLKILSLSFVIMALFPFAANAATPQETLPENTDLYIKINSQNIPSSLKTYYDDFLSTLPAEIYSGEDEKLQELAAYIVEKLQNSSFTLAFETNANSYSPKTYILFDISENEYSNNIVSALKNNSQISTIQGFTIYENIEIDIATTYYQGYLIIAPESEEFESFLSANNKLSENSDFQKIEAKFLSNSLADIYMNYSFAMQNFGDLDTSIDNSNSALESIGYSISATNNKININFGVNTDETIMRTNGAKSTTGKLSLQKYMPAQNPIYYSGALDMTYAKAILKNMAGYNEAVKEIENELEIDLDLILELLENEMALSIQDNGEILPSITMMMKVSDKSSAQVLLDIFINEFWNTLSQDAAVKSTNSLTFSNQNNEVIFSKFDTELDGQKMTQLNIQYRNATQNPYSINFDSLLNFKITLGITADNVLLFSSNQNILKEYGQGIKNTTIENLTKGSDNISYFDIKTLDQYFINTIDKIENFATAQIFDGTSLKSLSANILSPFGTITAKGENTLSFSESEAELNIDLQKLQSLFTTINPFTDFEEITSNFESIFASQKDFDDVISTDWYANDVYYLSTKGIINGYPDGSFKPGNTISKAEFITLLFTLLEKRGYIGEIHTYDYNEFANQYSDVDNFAWYTPYLRRAHANEIIEGSNGKLQPDKQLTRGEVAEITAKTIAAFNINAATINTNNPNYRDLRTNDSAYEAIKTMYQYGIMTGTDQNRFEKTRSINRAESAKVLKALSDRMFNPLLSQ